MEFKLWFDVEMRYKSITGWQRETTNTLWFDVEMRYKSIVSAEQQRASRCGLM